MQWRYLRLGVTLCCCKRFVWLFGEPTKGRCIGTTRPATHAILPANSVTSCAFLLSFGLPSFCVMGGVQCLGGDSYSLSLCFRAELFCLKMKTVLFESLRYRLITKNDFYYGSCPDIHITTPIPKRKISCCYSLSLCHAVRVLSYMAFRGLSQQAFI